MLTIYIYIYIYIHVCSRVCAYRSDVHVCITHTCIHTYIHTDRYLHRPAHTYAQTFIRNYTCLYMYTQIMCLFMQVCIYELVYSSTFYFCVVYILTHKRTYFCHCLVLSVKQQVSASSAAWAGPDRAASRSTRLRVVLGLRGLAHVIRGRGAASQGPLDFSCV